MKICNEPILFNQEQADIICKTRNAEYVVDTEQNGIPCAVYYGATPHPDSGSRYFALYWTPYTKELMITSGAFVEEQEFDGIIADNGDIIFSRSRHDYRVSDDESVWIDGGREYTRRPLVTTDRMVRLTVHKGRLEVWFNDTDRDI
jgi:hypothetical protein